GDHTAALAPITEAVNHYRQLAATNPGAFLPDLADSLYNVSRHQATSGDHTAALVSIAEAVNHYRRLATANPPVFVPRLGAALNNLSERGGDGEQADAAWDAAMSDLGHDPLAQAELLAHRAYRLARLGDPNRAVEMLVIAVGKAAAGEPERLARTRQTIRRVATGFELDDPRLAGWATDPIPESDLILLNAWASLSDWLGTETFLRAHAEHLRSPEYRHHLRLADALFPENPRTALLTHLLDDIEDRGLTTVLADGRRAYEASALLSAWIATPTWAESRDFHLAHRDELHAPDVMAMISQMDSQPVVSQHLGILRIAEAGSIDLAYAVVVDPAVASAVATAAVEEADLDLLAAVAAAGQQVLESAQGPLFAMLLAVAADSADSARRIAARIVENSAPVQREAYAIHLRELARRRPDLAEPAGELAEVLHPAG
ncbi:hypothetical protein ACFVFS_09495, partial [Kitasatospora sp. NPDC057692]